MFRRYLLLLLFFPLTYCIAQQVDNVRAENKGDVIYVFYDLKGSLDHQKYKIALYSSHNQLQEPVALVSGNVGDTISEGKDKKIEWQVKNELTRYNGELTFEVQATLVYSPLVMMASQVKKVYKRGKGHTFSWKGGVAGEKVRIQLYEGNTRVMETEDVTNRRLYALKIPATVKPGDNYRLKVTTLNHPDNYTISPTFTVRRRYSWPVKLVPFAIAAIPVIYLLLHEPDLSLPGPPPPPE